MPMPMGTAPPPPKFHSGRLGTVKVGADGTANSLPATRWNVDPTVQVVEFKNSKTGLFAFKEGTFRECPFSFEIDWDFANNPFIDADLPINAGLYLSNVKLHLRDAATPDDTAIDYWLFPSALIIGVPQSLEIEGKIVTTVNCTNDGPFAYPGGDLPEGVTSQGMLKRDGTIVPFAKAPPREVAEHIRAAQERARKGVVMRPDGSGNVREKPIAQALPQRPIPPGARAVSAQELADAAGKASQ